VVMAVGALPFVFVATGSAVLALVAVATCTIVVTIFPLLGPTLSASFLPRWLVYVASVTASSYIAFVATYDYSTLGDFERLILGL
jgi:hypothetical protein